MTERFKGKPTCFVAGAMAIGGLLGATGVTHADGPPIGEKVDAHLGFTITTDYYWRGIAQENEGAIFQPEFEVGFRVWEGEVMGEDVALRPYLNAWMSLHDGGATSVAGGSSAIFEVDYTLGTGIEMPWGFDLDLHYIFYTFPSATVAGTDTQEFVAKIGYDAGNLLEILGADIDGLGLSMYKLIAVETTNPSSGADRGVYGEFNIEADYEFTALGEDLPITASIGSTLGWSYKDFYQGTGVNNRDWGFVTLDLGLGMPLTALIPEEFGEWSIEMGLSLMWIGNAPSALGAGIATGSERFKPLWHATIGVDF